MKRFAPLRAYNPGTGVVWSALKGICLSALLGIGLSPATAAAQNNPIVIENQQPGTSQWQISGVRANDTDGQIKGYASATSVNKGETITFHVSVNPVQTYTIDVFRLGWYQGLGARLMQHIGPLNGVQQSTCPTDPTTGMIECHWTPSYTLATQTSWTSGIYLALLTNAQNFQNYIVFAVRDDSRIAALLYQQPVTTYQAYNDYPNDGATGKSLYAFNSYGATTVTGDKNAAKVSFDRPYHGDGTGIDWGQSVFAWEISFIRWIEQAGYDVTYSTDVDTHTNGGRLLNYRGFLSVGHDEYWSKPMFDAVLAARDAGVHLAFFSANTIYWQIRFEPSSSGVPNRVQVGYKNAAIDPISDPSLKTVLWRDPPVNRPEQTLIGVQFTAGVPFNNGAFVPYVVTNSSSWVYAGTGFQDGDSLPKMVGYEADRLFSQYAPPTAVAGTYTLLSHSPIDSTEYSNSSVYQAPSGAWVFGAGTTNWSLALDNTGVFGGGLNIVDPRIQRTTANILDRFISDFTALEIGPSSMEGHLRIRPGDWISGGYSFKFTDKRHGDTTVTVSSMLRLPFTCPKGGGAGGEIVINLGTHSYIVPAGNNDWQPTGDAKSVLSWAGSAQAPNGCSGNIMDNRKGAIFDATISQNLDMGQRLLWRFKYRDPNAEGKGNVNCLDTTDPRRNRADVCGASWSEAVKNP